MIDLDAMQQTIETNESEIVIFTRDQALAIVADARAGRAAMRDMLAKIAFGSPSDVGQVAA